MNDQRFIDAVRQGDIAAVSDLLNAGANVDAIEPGIEPWHTLHAAIEAIDEEGAPLKLLELLLEHGATVDSCKQDGTPLLMAVLRGQLECARLLLAHGANPDVRGSEGDTPIGWAVTKEPNLAMAELLLAHGVGATLDMGFGIEGSTPLGAAAVRGRLDMVELLLAHGADPDAIDTDRMTAEERIELERQSVTKRLERARNLIRAARSKRD